MKRENWMKNIKETIDKNDVEKGKNKKEKK